MGTEENTTDHAGAVVASALRVVHPSWHEPLADVHDQIVTCLSGAFRHAQSGTRVLPAPVNVLRALHQPLDEVKVLIVGQDPYPTPGHPIGLCFAVSRDVRPLPRSLVNMYTELADDIGCRPPQHGDLSAWADQGVMLLNRVLTVAAGHPGSHAGKGWEAVTDAIVAALVARGGPLVAILWGRHAQSLLPALGDVPTLCSPHPSPLSASRGFFGSAPFSRANALLASAGADPVDWSLTD